MTANPAWCVPDDSAQQVARTICERKVGSLPVVIDQPSRKLLGMITDRDLCCSIVARGLDPKTTPIEKFITLNPLTCRDGENVQM